MEEGRWQSQSASVQRSMRRDQSRDDQVPRIKIHLDIPSPARPKEGQAIPNYLQWSRGVLFTTLRRVGMADFHIHDLRHDFASKLLRSSRNLALVQKALGHSDIKSTVRYAHVLDDEVVEAMDAMTVPDNVPESLKSKKQT